MLRRVQLSDRAWLEPMLAQLHDPPAQLLFASLLLSGEAIEVRVHQAGGLSFVTGWSSEGDFALYGPPLPRATEPEHLAEQLEGCRRAAALAKAGALSVYLLHEGWLPPFRALGARIEATRYDDNYVYETGAVARLLGRDLELRRETARAFRRRHGPLRTESLRPEHAPAVRALLRAWRDEKDAAGRKAGSAATSRFLDDDYTSALAALDHLGLLPLLGSVYYLGDELVGFVSGVALSGDTFALLHQKNRRLRGLSEVILSSFAGTLGDRYPYLNLGGDLEIASLGFYKKSWRPCRMLRTYRARWPALPDEPPL